MKRKYPWEKWFGDGFAVVMRGVDYHCSQSIMVQIIRNRASSLGLKLNIVDTGTEIILTVVGKRAELVGPVQPLKPRISRLRVLNEVLRADKAAISS